MGICIHMMYIYNIYIHNHGDLTGIYIYIYIYLCIIYIYTYIYIYTCVFIDRGMVYTAHVW